MTDTPVPVGTACDTSTARVEKFACDHDESARYAPLTLHGILHSETAEMLRALAFERDHWRAMFKNEQEAMPRGKR